MGLYGLSRSQRSGLLAGPLLLGMIGSYLLSYFISVRSQKTILCHTVVLEGGGEMQGL